MFIRNQLIIRSRRVLNNRSNLIQYWGDDGEERVVTSNHYGLLANQGLLHFSKEHEKFPVKLQTGRTQTMFFPMYAGFLFR